MAGSFKIQKFNNGTTNNVTRVICNNFNNVANNGLSADSDLPFLSKSNNTVTIFKTFQEVADKTEITYNRNTGIIQACEFIESDSDPIWHTAWTGEIYIPEDLEYYDDIDDFSISGVINPNATKIRVTYILCNSYDGTNSAMDAYKEFDSEEAASESMYTSSSWYGGIQFTMSKDGTNLMFTDIDVTPGNAGIIFAVIQKIECLYSSY